MTLCVNLIPNSMELSKQLLFAFTLCLAFTLGSYGQNTNPGGCSYFYQPCLSNTFNIAQSSDDAIESLNSGAMILSGNTLQSQDSAGNPYLIGLRFDNVTLPPNAIVKGAYIRLASATSILNTSPSIWTGENVANSSTFTSSATDISSRSQTTTSVSWTIPQWGTFSTSGDITTSPDLTAIVNEIIAAGWTSGNAMTFMLDASTQDRRQFRSFDWFIDGMRSIPTAFLIEYELPAPACAGIAGTVYEDANDNGEFEAADPTVDEGGIPDVVVNAYDDNGLVYTTTTDGYGNWSFPSAVTGTTYRLEYVYDSTYEPAKSSSLLSSSSISFPTAPQCCIDYGLHETKEFGCADPILIAVCNVKCNNDGSAPSLISIPEAEKSNSTTDITTYNDGIHSVEVEVNSIGSTWGLAYNKKEDIIYTGAKFQIGSAVGPSGFGAIYCVDRSSYDANVAGSVNGSHTSLLGTVANAGTATTGTYGSCNNSGWNPEAFALADKVGLGDMDINCTNDTLFTVNLNTRELVVIPIDGCNITGPMETYPIPTPVGAGNTCGGDVLQPFGISYHQGKVYVGVVCTAELTQDDNNIWAYVYEYVPGSTAINPNTVTDFAMDYDRGNNGTTQPNNLYNNINWQPWKNTWGPANPMPDMHYTYGNQFIIYPQPILSDIEFTNGDMVLAFTDRMGNQFLKAGDPSGVAGTFPSYSDNIITSIPMGDLLRAGTNGDGTWTIENNSVINSTTTGVHSTSGGGDGYGPSGGEYYWGANYAAHSELSVGAVVQIPGNPDVINTAYDPTMMYYYSSGDPHFGSGGFIWMNNDTGAPTYAYEGYWSENYDFSKGNGFGDIEYICDCAPIEIGNRIWVDTDQDGVQDPSEAPIAGAIVNLYDASGNIIATTTTDIDGRYFFNSSNVTGGLIELSDYYIALDNTQMNGDDMLEFGGNIYGPLSPTDNSTIGETDSNDTDAAYPNTNPAGIGGIDTNNLPYIAITTGAYGANNFTYDFGLDPTCTTTQCATISVTQN